MIRDARALEDAEALVAERTPPDAVEVEQRRVRGQAGPDRRMRVVLGPLQHSCQAFPVGLVPQVRREGLGPSHDEAVEVTVPQIPDGGINAAHMASARLRSRNVRQCVEPQPHHDAVGRRVEEGQKLPLRRFQRGVRHVVDQADVDTVRVRFAELDRRPPA